jgi:hypothetical protein
MKKWEKTKMFIIQELINIVILWMLSPKIIFIQRLGTFLWESILPIVVELYTNVNDITMKAVANILY